MQFRVILDQQLVRRSFIDSENVSRGGAGLGKQKCVRGTTAT